MTHPSHTGAQPKHTGPKTAYTKAEAIEQEASAKTEAWLHDIADKSGKISAEIQEYTDVTAEYIRRHPVRSTIMAGLAGLLLGKLLSK